MMKRKDTYKLSMYPPYYDNRLDPRMCPDTLLSQLQKQLIRFSHGKCVAKGCGGTPFFHQVVTSDCSVGNWGKT